MSSCVDNGAKEELFEVLYNECYGGFSISKEALKRYNEKLLEKDPNAEQHGCYWEFNRTDPILLEVYHDMNGEKSEMGEGFNGKCAKVRIDRIPKKYEKYYYIREYDGTEDVHINYHKYEIDEIKNIAKDESLSFEERINKIQNYKIEIFY